jgi:hypothetical protein
VKQLRTFILVLLAVLLPIRGAVAAAMLCPEGVETNAAVAVAGSGHHEMHADRSASHHHDSSGSATDDSSSGGHPATCHFCAGGGCMATIVGTVPSLGQPDATASVTFPELTPPAPAFHSDGQDRPPRTI